MTRMTKRTDTNLTYNPALPLPLPLPPYTYINILMDYCYLYSWINQNIGGNFMSVLLWGGMESHRGTHENVK